MSSYKIGFSSYCLCYCCPPRMSPERLLVTMLVSRWIGNLNISQWGLCTGISASCSYVGLGLTIAMLQMQATSGGCACSAALGDKWEYTKKRCGSSLWVTVDRMFSLPFPAGSWLTVWKVPGSGWEVLCHRLPLSVWVPGRTHPGEVTLGTFARERLGIWVYWEECTGRGSCEI